MAKPTFVARPTVQLRTLVVPALVSVLLAISVPGLAHSLSTQTEVVHPIQHVVVIVLENRDIHSVWRWGEYEKYLAAAYGNESGYVAVCHPSSPNYFALVAAVSNQCGTDQYRNYPNNTLGGLLDSHGLSWSQFAENLPSTACSKPAHSTGIYVARHVPFLHFSQVTADLSYCTAHVQNASVFNGTVQNGTMLNYSFYSPNTCDDGHNNCSASTAAYSPVCEHIAACYRTKEADAWLRGFLSPALNHTGAYGGSAERADINATAWIIVWDEAAKPCPGGCDQGFATSGDVGTSNAKWCANRTTGGGAANNTVCGGRVFAVVVSPYSVRLSMSTPDTGFGVAATVEWLFALGSLNNPASLDTLAGYPAMEGLFKFPTNGY
jgi:hypothetical protein